MRRGVLNTFNRGEIDTRASMRDDVDRVTSSCETMVNFLPIRLGPMQYRPGTQYIGEIPAGARLVPFVAASNDTAILEYNTNALRVWVDDALVEWPTTGLTLTNEAFTTDLTGWTDASGAGSSTAWSANFSGTARIKGEDSTSGILYQTFGGVGIGVEHAIVISIFAAAVTLKLGQTGVNSDDIFSGTLDPGIYTFFFTPDTALPTVTLSNDKAFSAYVGDVTLQSAGVMELPLPDNISDLPSLKTVQSADVVFNGTTSTPQFKVERRGIQSWGVVEYLTNDGPFGLVNNTDITIAATGLTGDTILTSSAPLFTTDSQGELYKLTSASVTVNASVTAQDNGTDSVRVTGAGGDRGIAISITGVWAGTVTLQRSADDISWNDVQSYTENVTESYFDDFDNAILYYRLHVKTGDYTSGTVGLALFYSGGSIDGIARVISFTSTTVVDVHVIQDFGSVDPTRDWYTGEWSVKKGHPNAVSLYEGRLWWGGLTKIWGSVSDEYASFNDDLLGDSAPIRRTIGFGPVDSVDWLAPSSQLVMGLTSDAVSVRSSSFGEGLTPTNTNLKSGDSRGCSPVEPVKLDSTLIYVHRSLTKLIESKYSVDADMHQGTDLMMLNSRICTKAGGIVRIAISRQPETRIWVVMGDGTMRVWLFEPVEGVAAWSRITHATGTYEDIIVLPGDEEDLIYVKVNRAGIRHLEKFALIEDATFRHLDSAVSYFNPGTTLTGLDHLEGEVVTVWADNADRGTYTVVGGQITVTTAWLLVNAGLAYVADYKTLKVGHYVSESVIGQRKRIFDVHLSMLDFWPDGITLGPSFDELKPMPEIEYGIDLTTTVDEYDETPFEFDGNDDVNPHICLRATGPCTIRSMSYGVVQDGDKGSKQS